MTGIIVTGHGHYPTGLQSAVELVAGTQDALESVEFTAGMSTDGLAQRLEHAIDAVGTERILILTDLLGGSPFNTISTLISKPEGKLKGKQIKVLAGTNLGMMVEAVFARNTLDLDRLAEAVLQAGRDGIAGLDGLLDAQGADMEDEGI